LFNEDFDKISPNNEKMTTVDSERVDNTLDRLRIMLKSEKVREKGSQYLINNMLQLYKFASGRSNIHRSIDRYSLNSYQNYLEDLKFKKNSRRIEQNVKQIFSSNIIKDSINLIMRHLTSIRSSELEKFINLLIRTKYSNFNNWKLILKQYITYMSLLETNYQPLRNKDVVQILHHLKNIYTFLPYDADKEIQTFIERAIKESITYLIKNLEKMNNEEMGSIINSISKLGYLDEHNCSKIEKTLMTMLEEIPPYQFVSILFCICRNRCASNDFLKKLEDVSESILDSYLKDTSETSSYVVAMIAKCIN
jgi:hypothetical protein